MSQAEFDKAYADAGKLGGGTDADKLEFYALAKVAKGEDITKAPKPGMMDFAGKFKRKEWEKLVNEGMTADTARTKYVEKFNEMKNKHGMK